MERSKGDRPAVVAAPTGDDDGGGDDRALIRLMLALTPEQRLQGLIVAAAFFRSARHA